MQFYEPELSSLMRQHQIAIQFLGLLCAEESEAPPAQVDHWCQEEARLREAVADYRK